jgi:DNA-binding response OmpR family regulator
MRVALGRPGENGRVHVLLVEDDPSIAGSLGESLRSQGFDVHHVATG